MLAPVYTVAEIREIERAAQAQAPGASLMALAGRAAAEAARRIAGDRGREILLLAGPGNNGGDAFETAVHLKTGFYRTTVAFLGDVAKLPTDARAAFEAWHAAGGSTVDSLPGRRFDLIVDGLYGIGLARPIVGPDAEWIAFANESGAPILALDIPSGITGDTGEILGSAIRATATVSFIALKPGLLTLDGPDYAGDVTCAPLLDELALDAATLRPPIGRFMSQPPAADWPAPRPLNFHKGLAGTVAIVGGSAGMVGAALLAGRAALHAGAGKVFLGLPAPEVLNVDPLHPELMLRAADGLLSSTALDAIAIGPGLGTDSTAQRLTAQALRTEVPLVIDADALNLIASYHSLQSALATRQAPTILTPHPAEAARLLGATTAAIQSDRLRAARELARRHRAIVVLKGNGSIIAAPDGKYWINGSGNSGMAAVGMGDVLTGLIAAFVAQRLAVDAAARLGTWVHGAAGDQVVAAGGGPRGLTASELSLAARTVINKGAP